MKVVILCGGEGTRLREETETRPKPLVFIDGRPILWHIMKIYDFYGYNEFVLCLGYKGEMIKNYFLNYETMTKDFTISLSNTRQIQFHNGTPEENWRITFAETGRYAMTGARVKKIAKYIDEDCFMLTYGDGVADINISELVKFHKNHGKIATVTGVRPPSRFGEMIVDDRRVLMFSEKPQTSSGYINGGFFVLNRKIFDYLSDDDGLPFESTPLIALANEGQLMVFPHNGFWQPMDTYREYKMLNDAWERGDAKWKVWDKEVRSSLVASVEHQNRGLDVSTPYVKAFGIGQEFSFTQGFRM